MLKNIGDAEARAMTRRFAADMDVINSEAGTVRRRSSALLRSAKPRKRAPLRPRKKLGRH